MARRCPRSKPLGVARLMRHRLAIMREGWLTATRDAARARARRAVGSRARRRRRARPLRGAGRRAVREGRAAGGRGSGPKRALVYFGANAGPGRADADYIRAVIAAARHWRLPEEAIATLEGFAGRAGEAAAMPRGAARAAEVRDAVRSIGVKFADARQRSGFRSASLLYILIVGATAWPRPRPNPPTSCSSIFASCSRTSMLASTGSRPSFGHQESNTRLRTQYDRRNL